MSEKMWMVRAEVGGRLYEDFKARSVVAMGWPNIGDPSALQTREQFKSLLVKAIPDASPGAQVSAASQLFRFIREVSVGDGVVTYNPSERRYLLGRFTGAHRHDANLFPEDTEVREVTWTGEVARDVLSVETRNSLGSISTIFVVSSSAAAELLAHAGEVLAEADAPQVDEESASVDLLYRDQQTKAFEFIKDRLSRLTWDQMQEVVAGLLRAMGYKTKVSPTGADRGKDIVASRDGFGFEDPRIIVEVKHRTATMGASEIRSFLGGRHKDDRGLYVSSGGFTKDARYEADRASIRLTLMDLDDLVSALIEHYETLDQETQRLVPLRRLYWPL